MKISEEHLGPLYYVCNMFVCRSIPSPSIPTFSFQNMPIIEGLSLPNLSPPPYWMRTIGQCLGHWATTFINQGQPLKMPIPRDNGQRQIPASPRTSSSFSSPLWGLFPSLLLLLAIIFPSALVVDCAITSPTTIALRAKAITKIKTHATAFLTDQQLSDVLDTLSLDFYEGKDTTTMQNDVMNVVVGSLTGTQLMQGLNIYNTLTKDLGGSDATTAIIGKLTTVLMNNLSPFMNQLKNKVNSMKTKGKGQNACLNQQYRMTLQFFTFNRMKTILTRVKNNLDANTWTIAKKDIGSLINWTMYGL